MDYELVELANEIYDELAREDMIESFQLTGQTVMKTKAKYVLNQMNKEITY